MVMMMTNCNNISNKGLIQLLHFNMIDIDDYDNDGDEDTSCDW